MLFVSNFPLPCSPLTSIQVPSILEKQLSFVTSDKGWIYKVVPEEEDLPEDGSLSLQDVSQGVGTVNIWSGSWNDQPVTEMGWGIATAFQGRRFGTKAVSLVLSMAVADGRWGPIHVFTSSTNKASIAMCNTCGFVFKGEEIVDYDGRELHTNHYVFEGN